MAFSSSSSSLLLHFKLPIPYIENPFCRFSSNSCLVPTKIFPKCCSKSSKSPSFFKCYSQRQSIEQKTEEIEGKSGYEEQVYDFERPFSNLNQATLKREPEAFNGQCLVRLLTLSQVGRKQELGQRTEVIGGPFQRASGGPFGEKGKLEVLRVEADPFK